MSNSLHLVKGCNLPRNWEHAFGYPGNARWVAVYWTPGCDEAMYEDGQMAGTANFGPYLSLTRQYKLKITLALQGSGACSTANALSAIHMLGSSEDESTHRLLLDLAERKMYVAPTNAACEFLKQQYPERIYFAPALAIEADQISKWLEDMAVKCKLPNPKHKNFALCTCHHGWVTATDGGFDPCPATVTKALSGKKNNGQSYGRFWLANH